VLSYHTKYIYHLHILNKKPELSINQVHIFPLLSNIHNPLQSDPDKWLKQQDSTYSHCLQLNSAFQSLLMIKIWQEM